MKFENIVKTHHGTQFGFSRHYLLLYSVVLGLEAKSVFEFGIGFSTKVIMKALEKTKGRLTSVDVRDAEICGISKKEQCKFSKKWKFLHGRSQEILKDFGESSFDLVLHDGAHNGPTVRDDLKLIIPRIKKNGILLIHDTEHKYTDILDGVIEALKGTKHQRIELPYGCGLTIIRILEDFGNGEVTLTWKKQKRKK